MVSNYLLSTKLEEDLIKDLTKDRCLKILLCFGHRIQKEFKELNVSAVVKFLPFPFTYFCE